MTTDEPPDIDMAEDKAKIESPDGTFLDDPESVSLLATLVRAFRAPEIELSFGKNDLAILKNLAAEGLVDLANDGFVLTGSKGTYVSNSLCPPVTARGILYLERLPIDKFVDRPGLFRFLGWL